MKFNYLGLLILLICLTGCQTKIVENVTASESTVISSSTTPQRSNSEYENIISSKGASQSIEDLQESRPSVLNEIPSKPFAEGSQSMVSFDGSKPSTELEVDKTKIAQLPKADRIQLAMQIIEYCEENMNMDAYGGARVDTPSEADYDMIIYFKDMDSITSSSLPTLNDMV